MMDFTKKQIKEPTRAICPRPPCRGFTVTELLVACTLLVALLSVMVPFAVRSGRLWQDARYYRLAVDELANQLEYLTSLDEERRQAALENLEPSEHVRATLPNPELVSEILDDVDGRRLRLSIHWDRPGSSNPVSLVGWIATHSKTSVASPDVPQTQENKQP